MTNVVRVAVTKAGGRVARALVPRIAAGEMFGPDRRVALSLLDGPGAAPHRGEIDAMLGGVAASVLEEVRVADDAHRALAGADWVVLLDELRPWPVGEPARARAEAGDLRRLGAPINAAAPNRGSWSPPSRPISTA